MPFKRSDDARDQGDEAAIYSAMRTGRHSQSRRALSEHTERRQESRRFFRARGGIATLIVVRPAILVVVAVAYYVGYMMLLLLAPHSTSAVTWQAAGSAEGGIVEAFLDGIGDGVRLPMLVTVFGVEHQPLSPLRQHAARTNSRQSHGRMSGRQPGSVINNVRSSSP